MKANSDMLIISGDWDGMAFIFVSERGFLWWNDDDAAARHVESAARAKETFSAAGLYS